MKKLLLIILLFWTVIGYSQQVYEASSSQQSHLNFYVVSNMEDADLNVYIADSLCTVSKDGVWYPISDSTKALFIYRIVQNISNADIKIYFVSSAQDAGWRTVNKNRIYINARKRR